MKSFGEWHWLSPNPSLFCTVYTLAVISARKRVQRYLQSGAVRGHMLRVGDTVFPADTLRDQSAEGPPVQLRCAAGTTPARFTPAGT